VAEVEEALLMDCLELAWKDHSRAPRLIPSTVPVPPPSTADGKETVELSTTPSGLRQPVVNGKEAEDQSLELEVDQDTLVVEVVVHIQALGVEVVEGHAICTSQECMTTP
jgi:hypothetical protein